MQEISCFQFYKFSYFLYHATGKAGNAAIESVLGKRYVLKNSSSYSCQVKLHSEYLKNTYVNSLFTLM